jgi:DNA-directed RNA polymerase subunit RPC12/RpoP
MKVELYCPRCSCRLAADPNTPAAEILDRMTEEGPWYALGDGETFEDMIFTTLMAEGQVRCPECGDPVNVSEESLGRLTMEVLGSW